MHPGAFWTGIPGRGSPRIWLDAAATLQQLAAAGARLPVRAVAAAVFASTGLARLLPAGPAAAAAWQAGHYRRRGDASSTAGVWAVLAP